MTLHARVVTSVGTLSLDVSLEVGADEIMSLVGPNGSGKTSLIRAIAGLTPLDRGVVRLAGRVLEDPEAGVRELPEHRSIGVVFQDQRLFPNMSVLDNVAFGLRAKGVGKNEARRRALESLERLGIAERSGDSPQSLSGGESQRVAIARSLVTSPDLMLMDEPLSSQDAKARPLLLRRLVKELRDSGTTTLFVTHDPVEAAIAGDRIAVMEAGRIAQTGTAAELAINPLSDYAAQAVGSNYFPGVASGEVVILENGIRMVSATPKSGSVVAVIHPSAVSLFRTAPDGTPRNIFRGKVGAISDDGPSLRVQFADPLPIVAEITRQAASELGVSPGAELWFTFKATEVRVL